MPVARKSKEPKDLIEHIKADDAHHKTLTFLRKAERRQTPKQLRHHTRRPITRARNNIRNEALSIEQHRRSVPERRVLQAARDHEHPVLLNDAVGGVRVLKRDHGELGDVRDAGKVGVESGPGLTVPEGHE